LVEQFGSSLKGPIPQESSRRPARLPMRRNGSGHALPAGLNPGVSEHDLDSADGALIGWYRDPLGEGLPARGGGAARPPAGVLGDAAAGAKDPPACRRDRRQPEAEAGL